jgi:hypothetical protein
VAGCRLIASGEMGGTLPGTAAFIILLNKWKNLPENNAILHFIKNMVGRDRDSLFHIVVSLQHFVHMLSERFFLWI